MRGPAVKLERKSFAGGGNQPAPVSVYGDGYYN